MKKLTTLMIGTAALTLSGMAIAAPASPITTEYSKIKSIDNYAGDTTVFLEKNPAGCEQGFWMRPTQAGFEGKLKMLENAAHQNSRIRIVEDGADLWKQLEERNCRLDTVMAEPVANIGTKADTDGEPPIDVRKEREDEAKREQKALEASQPPPNVKLPQ